MIIKNLNGTITCRSQPQIPHGSTFYFQIEAVNYENEQQEEDYGLEHINLDSLNGSIKPESVKLSS